MSTGVVTTTNHSSGMCLSTYFECMEGTFWSIQQSATSSEKECGIRIVSGYCFWITFVLEVSLQISQGSLLRYKSRNQLTWSHFNSARPFAFYVAVLCDIVSLRAVAQLLTSLNANYTVMSSYRALTMHWQWHWKFTLTMTMHCQCSVVHWQCR